MWNEGHRFFFSVLISSPWWHKIIFFSATKVDLQLYVAAAYRRWLIFLLLLMSSARPRTLFWLPVSPPYHRVQDKFKYKWTGESNLPGEFFFLPSFVWIFFDLQWLFSGFLQSVEDILPSFPTYSEQRPLSLARFGTVREWYCELAWLFFIYFLSVFSPLDSGFLSFCFSSSHLERQTWRKIKYEKK